MFADAGAGMNLVRTTRRRASATVVNDRWHSSRQNTVLSADIEFSMRLSLPVQQLTKNKHASE
jgi:hypothetical protein